MNPHPLAPSPNLPRLFHPAYWLSGEGGQKASLRLAGATPGWSLKGPTLGAGQLAEGRWDLILWKPLPPEMEHTPMGGRVADNWRAAIYFQASCDRSQAYLPRRKAWLVTW
jgi:hypothetical protein